MLTSTIDLDDLLARLDDRQVTIFDGSVVTLKTRDVPVSYNRMNIVEDFLFTISDPNIAYLLLTLGALGIITEIFSPGLIFPGVIGGISLSLGFYALGMPPINYAGILLLVLAVGLFIAELFNGSF